MDFSLHLAELGSFLEARSYQWAVVGGVALAAYGMARTTLDLDIAVDGDAQEDLMRFLEARGFETLYSSAGYSNHVHPEPLHGRIDCAYVRGATREQLFAEVRRLPGPKGLPMPVAKPEHLIAMKVLAMKNDPDRIFQDLADIQQLSRLPGVDHDEIRRSFERHGLLERYRALTRKR